MHCNAVSWYCKKKLAKTVLPIFSTVRHSISVFLLYYTILYYNGKRMCTMSRTYAAQLRLAMCFWGVAAVGNDGSERLSFWLSNIQASVCCYPHRSDFTKKLPIFLQQRFYSNTPRYTLNFGITQISIGTDGSERLSFWLSNIQASVLLPT